MSFLSICIIENCMLRDLRKKAEYEDGKKVSEKNVVDVVFLGDKPLTCEISPDMIPSLKIGVWGAARIHEVSAMDPRQWTSDDGRSGISFRKMSGAFVLEKFAENPQGK